MARVQSLNPATGDTVELDINESSPDEVRSLCEAASVCAPIFAQQLLSSRAELLDAMASELEKGATSLVETAMRETALPQGRLEGELRRTAFQFRFFAQVVLDGAFLHVSIDHAGDSPMGPLPDLRRMRIPLGPVAVFGSSNFPFAFSVPGGDTASALAAGCPVVIKAHPAHHATSLAAFEALTRAAASKNAPEGLLGLVFGLDAGVALVDDPAITAVGFTGSVRAGVTLWRQANARATPIPFFGELGSANPLVVTNAALDRAQEIGAGIAGSMTLGVGQFCTKPGLIFVPTGSRGDELVHELAASLDKLDSMTMLSPGIAQHFREGVDAMANISGVRHLVGENKEQGTSSSAQLFEVTTLGFLDPSSADLGEECFGPVALVVRYESSDDLEHALDHVAPALTFSAFLADNDKDGSWLLAYGQRHAGRVIVNQFPTGVGVSWSMQHGGPWPATTAPAATSVGASGIDRWLRPVTFQGVPSDVLTLALRDDNPLGIPQRVNGQLSTKH